MGVCHIFRVNLMYIGDNVKIVSLNARGLANNDKRRQVLKWLENKKAKVICLQETHSTEAHEPFWHSEWPGNIFFSHGTSSARGTCILLHPSLPYTLHASVKDPNGRYVILDIEINGIRQTLSCIYGPNEDNADFYINYVRLVESFPNDNRVIGGDWNLVLDIELDKIGGRPTTNKKSQEVIKNWMEETELIDIWRLQHPEDKKFTWQRKNPTKILCRLDFFLISFGLTEKIDSSEISYGYKTDHSLISLNYVPFQSSRGKGFWKMNCNHLKDREYITKIKQVIAETAEINRSSNPHLRWDTIKMAVRGESIKFGARQKKIINNAIKDLEEKNLKLHKQLSDVNYNNNDILEQIELNKN